MKIKIDIFTKVENKFISNNNLNIFVNSLSEKEKKLLKKCSIYYEERLNNEFIINISNFIYYNVELNKNNEGIYIENTKNYYEIINEDSYGILGIENCINLVISKDGIKIEILLL